jgi:hypothetical protein
MLARRTNDLTDSLTHTAKKTQASTPGLVACVVLNVRTKKDIPKNTKKRLASLRKILDQWIICRGSQITIFLKIFLGLMIRSGRS